MRRGAVFRFISHRDTIDVNTEDPKTEFDGQGTEKVERVNPWLAVWLDTRKALRYAWAHIPEEYIHRQYMLAGLLFMLAIRLPDWLAITPNPVGVMIQVLLVGPVGGIMAGYFFSSALRMVGKWLGKDIPSKYVKCMVAWTQLPFSLAWGLYVATYCLVNAHQAALYPGEIWAFRDFLGFLPLIIAVPAFLWGITIRIRGIAVMLGFGTGRAALAWFLAFLIAYLPVTAFIIIYGIIYYVTTAGA
jgi:hypothetical protein